MEAAPLIRLANLADAAAIAEILNESILAQDANMILAPVSALEMAAELNKMPARTGYYVLEDAHQVLGWGVLKMWSPRGGYARTCESSVYVRRNQTGKGYGKTLIAYGLAQARTWQYHHVVARIWAANTTSIAVHEKFGYTLVGIQKEVGWMQNHWVDVAILQCLL